MTKTQGTEPTRPRPANEASVSHERDDSEFIIPLGKVESLTRGGGKTYEDNGAIYQRG